MLIACPACASEYEIEGVLVGPEGRSVRCAACGETWFVAPETTPDTGSASLDPWDAAGLDAAPSEPFAPPPPVIDQPMPPPREARARPAAEKRAVPRLSPALAAGLALVAILPLAMVGRAGVVRAMPQSAGLFSAVGLPVNLRGVALRDIVAFQAPAEGGTPARLVVEGDLVGVARERVALAPLEIELRDAEDRAVHRWTVAPSRPALDPGETARFRASLSAPPPRGIQVLVRFADAEAPDATAAASSDAPSSAGAPLAAAEHGRH